MCFDLLEDPQNCGMCKLACADHQVCVAGDCVEAKYIFVTMKPSLGSLGGLPGAAAICEVAASEVSLPGVYLPWLGTLEQPPLETQSRVGPYVRVDGEIVAYDWEDLVDGELLAPIDVNELGQPIAPAVAPSCQLEHAVWTGTDNAGAWAGDDCGGWADLQLYGNVGDPTSTTHWSTSQLCSELCSASLPLYCVRQ
jgi:hypothetical protein